MDDYNESSTPETSERGIESNKNSKSDNKVRLGHSSLYRLARTHRYKSLFVVITFFYLITVSDHYIGIIVDGRTMVETAVALREFGELTICPDPDPATGNIPYTNNNRYSKYGLGYSLVLQIPVWLARPAERLFGPGSSNFLFVLLNLILISTTALILAACLRDIGIRFRNTALAAIGFAFGTFAWPYISSDFSEPLQACCLILTFWLLIRFGRQEGPGNRLLILAGAIIGFAILTKVFLVLFIPSFALYLWLIKKGSIKEKAAKLCLFLIPLFFVGFIQGALNYHQFGSLFRFGYQEEAYHFTTPLFDGLYGLILSPNKGLIFYAPVVILFPIALRFTFQKYRPEWLFLTSALTIYIIAISKWWGWEGGWAWGPRYLWPILPFVVFGSALWLQNAGKSFKVFVCCFLIGFAINLLGVLVFFGAWLGVLDLHHSTIPLPVSGRHPREYIEENGKRWFLPDIGASYIIGLSPIYGHAWIIRLRYFNTPFSLRELQPEASGQIPPVSFPPLTIDFNTVRSNDRYSPNRMLVDHISSPHFWLLGKLKGEKTDRESVYSMALEGQGELAVTRNNLQRAVYCFREALWFTPDSEYYCIKLAGIYQQLGEMEEAKQLLVPFINSYPGAYNAVLRFGVIIDQEGNTAEALQYYQSYLTLAPDSPKSLAVKQRIDEITKTKPQKQRSSVK